MNLDHRYPPGSPHHALATWLDAWRAQDWDRMVMASQPSWRSRQEDARGMLLSAYERLRLASYTVPIKTVPIVRIDNPLSDATGWQPFVCFVDIRCRTRYAVIGDDGQPIRDLWAAILARVVRQHSDGTTAERDDPAGAWWTNPISMTCGHLAREKDHVPVAV